MNILNKVAARWFGRSLIFLSLAVIFSLLLFVSSLGTYFFDTEIGSSYVFLPLIILAILILVSAITEKSRFGGRFLGFGLFFDRNMVKDIFIGFAAVAAAFLSVIILGLIFGASLEFISAENSVYFSIIILLMLFGAAMEELVFRGILFQALLERFGVVVSVTVGSIIFGLIHVVNESFTFFALINIILGGVLLSMMYIRTRSLWLPISFHFFWNLGQATILNNYVSGINFDIPVSTLNLYHLPEWLFGGYFGIEGGFISIFILFVMIPILSKFTDVSPRMSAYYFKQRFEESKLREKKAA